MNRDRRMKPKSLGKRAVVIGASMGGLLAARALAQYFDQVAVLERDAQLQTGEARKGVPQGRHTHALLSAGYNELRRLFPGIEEDLAAAGAVFSDVSSDGVWFLNGGHLASAVSGLTGVGLSRPQLEAIVLAHVIRLPNVSVQTGVLVTGLNLQEGRRVTGVHLDQETGSEVMVADLVVDASGRGSRTPAWLEPFDYTRPKISEVKIDLAYTTRTYRRSSASNEFNFLAVAPTAPLQKRGAVVVATENNDWTVTFTGMLGDHPPLDDAGLLEFARSLPTPEVYKLVSQAEPLSEAVPYKYPSSLRHHYENLQTFPEGYLVFGDAISSFNPAFGQGMTVAILESRVLEAGLAKGLGGMWKRFFKSASKVVDAAWALAASADVAFPETVGKRSREVGWANAYTDKVLLAARTDPVLAVAFHQVSNLIKPPNILFAPNITWRVIRGVTKARRTRTGDFPNTALGDKIA